MLKVEELLSIKEKYIFKYLYSILILSFNFNNIFVFMGSMEF